MPSSRVGRTRRAPHRANDEYLQSDTEEEYAQEDDDYDYDDFDRSEASTLSTWLPPTPWLSSSLLYPIINTNTQSDGQQPQQRLDPPTTREEEATHNNKEMDFSATNNNNNNRRQRYHKRLDFAGRVEAMDTSYNDSEADEVSAYVRKMIAIATTNDDDISAGSSWIPDSQREKAVGLSYSYSKNYVSQVLKEREAEMKVWKQQERDAGTKEETVSQAKKQYIFGVLAERDSKRERNEILKKKYNSRQQHSLPQQRQDMERALPHRTKTKRTLQSASFASTKEFECTPCRLLLVVLVLAIPAGLSFLVVYVLLEWHLILRKHLLVYEYWTAQASNGSKLHATK